MDIRVMTVLLVGQTARSSLRLVQWLENHACQCHFADSCKDACASFSRMQFDFVLSPYELPDRNAYPLLKHLIGSTSTLFFSVPVENGCLWVPTLARGKKWPASSALRPAEFADTLRKAVNQLKYEQAGLRNGARRTEFHAQDSVTIAPNNQAHALPQTVVSETVLQPPRLVLVSRALDPAMGTDMSFPT
jgi:PleD family two-component response regulator